MRGMGDGVVGLVPAATAGVAPRAVAVLTVICIVSGTYCRTCFQHVFPHSVAVAFLTVSLVVPLLFFSLLAVDRYPWNSAPGAWRAGWCCLRWCCWGLASLGQSTSAYTGQLVAIGRADCARRQIAYLLLMVQRPCCCCGGCSSRCGNRG